MVEIQLISEIIFSFVHHIGFLLQYEDITECLNDNVTVTL